ncbi:DEAD/DEAH box helicase, partial [bacterium]|nr:DEAD/DEAH box helicase [bacterium]
MKGNGYPYIEVVFAVPVRQAFTYTVPEHLQQQVKIGCRVEAPFGKRNEIGYIVSHRQEKPREIQKIKPITRQIDEIPIFEPSLLPFLDWVANYYLCSRGEVYAAAYPFSPDIQPKKVTYVILKEAFRNEPALLKGIRGDAQNKVIAFLLENPGRYSPSQIAKRVGVSQSPIKTLQQNGVIELVEAEEYRGPTYSSHEITQQFQLTQEQEQCISHIETALDLSKPKPILIQGVTGSGKTEIYLQAIHRVLRRGKNALVLIPEIALTPQTMDRFRQRFGADVGILHSGLGAGERYDEWRLARQGKRHIIVGTRSAVFAPIKNLGIVIVDEEHE